MARPKTIPKVQVKHRLNAELIRRLRIEAAERSKPLTEVIEERLERSMDREGLLFDVLAIGYGKNVATIFTEAERNKMLKLREADKAHLKKCFDQFLDQIGKGKQK